MRFGSLISLLILTGCVTSSAGTTPRAGGGTYDRSPVTTAQKFACSGGDYAYLRVYSPEEADLSYKGKSYALMRQETPSGVLYAGRGAEFWNKGISALVTVNGKSASCNFIPRDRTETDPLFPAADTQNTTADASSQPEGSI